VSIRKLKSLCFFVSDLNVKVKWNNGISEIVEVKQGIRQGAKLSTVLYKRYNNNILNALDRSNMGAEIGSSWFTISNAFCDAE
jgi:hypothetical protein